jgi:hypothetical protein
MAMIKDFQCLSLAGNALDFMVFSKQKRKSWLRDD